MKVGLGNGGGIEEGVRSDASQDRIGGNSLHSKIEFGMARSLALAQWGGEGGVGQPFQIPRQLRHRPISMTSLPKNENLGIDSIASTTPHFGSPVDGSGMTATSEGERGEGRVRKGRSICDAIRAGRPEQLARRAPLFAELAFLPLAPSLPSFLLGLPCCHRPPARPGKSHKCWLPIK